MMRQAIAPMEIRGGSDGPIRQYGDCHLQAGPVAEADPAQAPSGLGLLLHSEAFALRAATCCSTAWPSLSGWHAGHWLTTR